MKKLPKLNQKTRVWSNHVLTKEIKKKQLVMLDVEQKILTLKQSHYEIEIWAGFRPVCSTEKKILGNFCGQFFHVFMCKSNQILF